MRQRGVKILRKQWDPLQESLVKAAWKSFPDFFCALLIVERLDEDFVREHLQGLVEQFRGTRHLAKPFLRLKDNLLTEKLSSLDEITYCYVRAKEKRPLQRKEALAIFNRNKLDERVGLLIWSFGQMGLWDVLVTITRQASTVFKLKMAESRLEYGS